MKSTAFAFIILRRRYVSTSVTSKTRTNEIGIQMLPERLHKSVFPHPAPPSKSRLSLARKHLEKHKLWDRKTTFMPDVDGFLQVPPLEGNDIYQHFQSIAYHTHRDYFDVARRACSFKIPQKPRVWNTQSSGWTRYDCGSGTFAAVDFPAEDTCVFDVEVLAEHTKYPVMATAVSDKAWYSWLSPALFSNKESVDYQHLIPFGDTGRKRLIIGHGVSYDRARIAEEYSLIGTKNRFLDTMSLHVAVAGLSSVQRPVWKRIEKERQTSEYEDEMAFMFDPTDLEWASMSSANSLKDLSKFYLNHVLDKEARDVFVTGSLDDVKNDISNLLDYCANDVIATHNIYKIVFPKFMSVKTNGNMVSFAGALEMGSPILPVTNRWNRYVDTCDSMVDETQGYIDNTLLKMAKDLLTLDESSRQKDHYYRQLDWSPGTKRNPEIPKWFKQLIPSKQQEPHITIKTRIAPLLLRLKWMDFPLYYLGNTYGWCFRVPLSSCRGEFDKINSVNIEEIREKISADESKSKSGASVNRRYLEMMENDLEEARFFKLPSPSRGVKEKNNCGSPFAKLFLHDFETGKMNASHELAFKAIKDNISCSYWNSSRDRIRGQFVVPLKSGTTVSQLDNSDFGVILPQMNVMGTVTRRAVESTWLTASNAKKDRIGSELKSMVQSPSGYKIIGADVDSQELWLASLMGDAQFGIHGATAFGWMTLQGSKSDGTDLHSKSAQILGSSRDQAKVFNYARIYGSGVKFSTDLLRKCDTSLDTMQAMRKVQNLYQSTKGVKRNYDKRHARLWCGGTESFMFNSLEQIALSDDPRTPALGCEIPDSLISKKARQKYITSCVNWVVQSSGVDYLHLLLSSMAYLSQKFDINARLLITIHDEIRYLVKEEDAERAALALQIGNLWTRSLFAHQVGMSDLPLVSHLFKFDYGDIQCYSLTIFYVCLERGIL